MCVWLVLTNIGVVVTDDDSAVSLGPARLGSEPFYVDVGHASNTPIKIYGNQKQYFRKGVDYIYYNGLGSQRKYIKKAKKKSKEKKIRKIYNLRILFGKWKNNVILMLK